MSKLFDDLATELSTHSLTLSASQFADLELIDANLNRGEKASSYVTFITDALIKGNPANGVWTGGSVSTSPLGNLAIGDTATHISELDGKWFLGTDLPGMGSQQLTYVPLHNPVFGPTGPSMNDINQGSLGDCYLLATLAEVAFKNPAIIQSMITSNGNPDTYGVRFFVKGVPTYVTVNNDLVSGGDFFGGTLFNNANFIWGSLIEKAYAQIQASGIITGNTYDYGNSFYSIGLGGTLEDALEEITNASTITDFVANGSTWDMVTYNKSIIQQSSITGLSGKSVLQKIISCLAHGNDLILGSNTNAWDSNGHQTLFASHAMSIYGYDSATGLIEIRNPWGTDSGQYWDTTFEVSLDTLLAAGDIITVDNITSSSSPIVSDALASGAAGLQGTTSIRSFTITDTADMVSYYLDSLASDTKLTSITLTDATQLPIEATAYQSVHDNTLLSKITVTYNLTVIGTSGADTLMDTANS